MRHSIVLSLGLGLGITLGTFAFGCSATSPRNNPDNEGGAAGGGGEGNTGNVGNGGSGLGTGGQGGEINFPVDGGGGNPPLEPGEVYGHSSGTLYKLEPYSKQVTVIGAFKGCSSVYDLAIDKNSKIIATTNGGLYWIDKTTAQCTLIASGNYPNSLSFIPEGILDPTNEVLVGYEGATYVRINTTTGQISNVGGSIGGGYQSSGDIVSVKGGGTYLTVKGNNCGDCLVEVNPKTGAMVKFWGPVNYGSVFGLAYWAGSLYGFSSYGQLFEMTLTNGVLISSGEINIPNAPFDLSFWGAGSTTIAPVEPPPK